MPAAAGERRGLWRPRPKASKGGNRDGGKVWRLAENRGSFLRRGALLLLAALSGLLVRLLGLLIGLLLAALLAALSGLLVRLLGLLSTLI
jgi:hypothetical protein